jgi:hypothetical protein
MIIPLDTLDYVVEMKFTLVNVRNELLIQFLLILVSRLRSLAKLK